ncbi:hypothetical protein [[Mycoplasma] anseris]|uniref:Uncharacterized protein n=1 Tax=[Mycoplasma] anseris TaxID=92400 RepID=A0A2Z4NC99_9BACT|nr:hypothetical protein [[Mycoplasma] anseris]AWX69174.1 hypothetical protein DP065_00095 [[Mycoplasma] anseris]
MKKQTNNLIKKSKKQYALQICLWTFIPIGVVASVGGAIYFLHKNSRPLEKKHLSPEEFIKLCEKIELSPVLDITQNANTIYDNFQKAKSFKTIKPESRNNSESDNKEDDIDKNDINAFDPHRTLSIYVSNNLTFENQRQLVVEYLDLKKVVEDENMLEIFFTVKLNYEYTKGVFEWKKYQGTEKSKYYYKGSRKIKFVSLSEDWDSNPEFLRLLNERSEEIAKIIRHRDSPEDGTGEQWFNSEEFRNQVFEWFKKLVLDSNAQPDLYDKESFDIIPYLKNDNFVVWIPNKGLNNLQIDYQYRSKQNSEILSEGRRKIFTIQNV